MKKFLVIGLLIVVLFCVVICFGVGDKNTYIRIKITANSLREIDKNIKYKVKDKVVEFVTPYILECESYEEVYNVLNKNIETISCIIDGVLAQNNLDYKCDAQMGSEYFPARNYDDITISNGFYDAISINLGKAEGDNWWCVLYPPLCFNNSDFGEVKYKSRFVELINSFLFKGDK